MNGAHESGRPFRRCAARLAKSALLAVVVLAGVPSGCTSSHSFSSQSAPPLDPDTPATYPEVPRDVFLAALLPMSGAAGSLSFRRLAGAPGSSHGSDSCVRPLSETTYEAHGQAVVSGDLEESRSSLQGFLEAATLVYAVKRVIGSDAFESRASDLDPVLRSRSEYVVDSQPLVDVTMDGGSRVALRLSIVIDAARLKQDVQRLVGGPDGRR